MVLVKKTLLYIVLFFYAAGQLKPFVFVVKDVVAHSFFKMQHLASVHYERGAYHLHLEIETQTKKEENPFTSKTNSEKKQDKNWPQIVSEFDSDISLHLAAHSFNNLTNSPLFEGYTHPSFRPPGLA